MRFIVFLLTAAAMAQNTPSTLTGLVKDSTGAVIPGARVNVTGEESGVAVVAMSNAAGLYRTQSLVPGVYRVETEAQGFQRLIRSGLTVQIGQTLQLDLTLQVGNVQESVNVTGTTPVLETQSATVTQLVEKEMVQGMPMQNRTSTALLALIPAAAIQSVTGDIPVFSVAGGRTRNQQFSLDGGNHTNTVGLAVNQSQVPLPMDAMQEFRVIANSYSAEYGQSQSGVITLATRSGTNRFHGGLFEYMRNESFDARNFFAAVRPKFRQHQFGGLIGGPARKDRTHFFFTYERTQQVTGGTAVQNVPTPLQRQGNFSQTLDARGQMILIYDPATTNGNARQPFAGNMVPAIRIDAVAKNIAAFWPDPNQPGIITGANNFSLNTRPYLNRDIYVGRFDHQFRPSDQLMVRYFLAQSGSGNPGLWPDVRADASAARTDQNTHNILGTWSHTFRPTILNEFRFGLVQRDFFNQKLGLDQDYAGQLGLRGVSKAAFPIIGITGITGLSGAPFRFSSPLLDFQIQNAVSWFRGKHAVKIGVESRLGIFHDDTDTSSSGNFSFTPLLTALPNVANTGVAFATFLLGEANAASILRPDPLRSRASYWGAYAQDDWRVTNTLTINLGLRWEATTPRTETENRLNSFDTKMINPVSNTPGVVTFAGRNGVPSQAWDFDAGNFGPRAGLSWRLMEKTVLRAGGGVIFGAAVNSIVGTAASLGFSTSFALNSTQPGFNSALRLRDGFPAQTRVPVDQLGAGFGAVAAGRAPNTAVTFFERARPTPVSYQYNLNVQRELAASLLVELGYLGNLSHHLTAPDLSINQVPPDKVGPGDAQSKRPFPQFSNVSVLNPPLGNSAYHAGFVKVERRFHAGLSLLSHYTYAKYLDDIESFTELGDAGSYMDFYNRKLDRGLSASDVRHRAVLSAVYAMPLWKEHRWLSRVIGGWKTGVIASYQAGPPFSVFNAVNATNAFPSGTGRPDLVGDPRSATPGIARWFNTDAFRAPAPFRFGTAGRSILNGPSTSNIDTSFIKSFPLRETWRVEVRGEFFNLLNHANFNLPGHSQGGPGYGVINSAKAGRSGQFVLRLEF
ncbi:MAG: TonB-dependent receptor [Candidatus Solibacter usitatus]|nr:TonB-dependent receptor [Candidatus Solibacter usitatus]